MASDRRDRVVGANHTADLENDLARFVQYCADRDQEIRDLRQRVQQLEGVETMLGTHNAQLQNDVDFLLGVVRPVQLRGLSDILVSRYGLQVMDEDRRPCVRIASAQLASVLAIESEDVERVLMYEHLSFLSPLVTDPGPVKALMSETKERIALCPGRWLPPSKRCRKVLNVGSGSVFLH
jgi:hypothetical protein